MSASSRRSTPDTNFGDDQVPEDQGTMQDIAISGGGIAMNEDGGDPESQPEPGQATVLDKSALRRCSAWITLVVASSLAYASLAVEKASANALDQRVWSFAVLGTTMVISLGVAACFVAPDCNPCARAFVSSSSSTARFFELFLSLLMFILWCIGLPIIMDPSNGIAIGLTQIVNANLYLASWVCFGCVVFIVGDLMGDLFTGEQGSGVGLSRLGYQRFWKTRRGKWFALTAITGIALSGSVRTFQAFDCRQAVMNSNSTCIDTKIAISMTVLAGIISLIMVGIGRVGGMMAVHVEKVLSIAANIVWTIGLVVVTFGEGPGHSLGNLFFATWGGFITSVLITADCYRNVFTRRAAAVTTEGNNPNNNIDQIEMQEDAGVDDSDI